MADDRKIRVHIKNNHWSPDSFPNTPESEMVFAITRERYDDVARRHGEIARWVEPIIDWDLEHFNRSMASAEVLVTWDLPTKGLAARAPRLKWIHIIGAGVEHLMPMDWLPPGVVLTNNKGVHAKKGGEYGLMAMLMLNAAMPAMMRNQQRHQYAQIFASPLAGKTVAIIGVGNIGGAFAGHAKALGMTVLGVSRHGRDRPNVDRMYRTDEIDAVLPRADFLFVSTPLTAETRNLIDRRRLGLMRRAAGLINVGRGAVVDYAALTDMLRDGRLRGAVLDVFDPEPLPADSPLWDTPNLVITPHVSSDDGESYVPSTLELVFENLGNYLAGRPLRNRVDPALGY